VLLPNPTCLMQTYSHTSPCHFPHQAPCHSHVTHPARQPHAPLDVLHMGQGNPKHKSKLCGEWTESSPEEQDLRVLADEKLNMTRQCTLAALKANCPLGCIPSNVGTGRGGILPLCPALLRPHQDSCVQLWSPQHRTELELWERRQRRPQQ